MSPVHLAVSLACRYWLGGLSPRVPSLQPGPRAIPLFWASPDWGLVFHCEMEAMAPMSLLEAGRKVGKGLAFNSG